MKLLTLRKRHQHVANQVDEGVFVPNDVTGWPVVARVRVAAIGGLNHTETLTVIRILVIVILELIHPLHVEDNRALGAIDFKLVVVLASGSHTGGFKRSNSTTLKAGEENRAVINGDFAHLITGLAAQTVINLRKDWTLLHKCVHHPGNFRDLTHKVARHVNRMGNQVAMRATASDIALEAPNDREVWIHNPVLKIDAAPVINPAKVAILDHLFGQCDSRHATVVETNRIWHVVFCNRILHRASLGNRACKWLFAEHHLASLSSLDGNFDVRIAGRDDVNEVDVIAGDDLAPVGLIFCKAKLFGGGFYLVLGAPTQYLQDRFDSDFRKELGQLAIGIGVRFPHELITNQCNTNLLGS